MTMYKRPEFREVTIASSGTTSAAIYTQDYLVTGLLTDDSLTSTTATFKGAVDKDGDFEDVYDSDGNQVSLDVAANRAIGLSSAEADALAPWPWIKVVMGSSEGAERTLYLSLR